MEGYTEATETRKPTDESPRGDPLVGIRVELASIRRLLERIVAWLIDGRASGR